MVGLPAEIPTSTPVVGTTVACAVLLLLQVPPAVPLASVIAEFTHTGAIPVMAPGFGLIVSDAVIIQPVGKVYVIVEVPVDTPVAIPLAEPIVATAVLLLVHVPPPDASVKVVVVPGHACNVPEIAAGNGFTVTACVAIQPVGSV